MKKVSIVIILLCLIFGGIKAQVYQLPNGGFELWDGNGANDEPTYWNGFPTADCSLTLGCNSATQTRHQKSTDIRPGSTGSYSCKIFATKITILWITAIANGNITTGKINVGSSTPANLSNHNLTQTGNADHRQALNAKPDSIRFWAKFQCPSSSQEARMSAVIHDDYDYKEPNGDNATIESHVVGKAVQNFTKGDQEWKYYSVPFNYNFSATTPEYILLTFTTNVTPGAGSESDFLFIDDVELIYNVNLNNLLVNGVGISDFDPNITDYYVDAECNSLENLINATAASPNANVEIVQATEADPIAVITVTSGDQEKIYRVHLTNYMSSDKLMTASICEGTTYSFFGQELSVSNVYRHTLQNVHGCDSVIVLTLTVNPVYFYENTHTMCEGESYTWHETEYSVAGEYFANYRSINNCDSIYKLTLTVNPVYSYENTHTMCEGDTYTWHGTEYTAAGEYFANYRSINNCDSIYKLTLTVNPVYFYENTHTMCEGETYTWHGTEYTVGGEYFANYRSMNDCDSIYKLTLTVTPVYFYENTHTMCEGETYTWHETEYNVAGEYFANYRSMNNCDSIYKLTLTVNPVYFYENTHTMCEGDSYTWHETEYTVVGEYFANYRSMNNCDSIYKLTLTVNPVYFYENTHTMCEGETYTWHETEYTTAGEYFANYRSMNDCDSIYKLTLTVNPITTNTIEVTSCGNYLAPDGVIYTDSGIKTAIIPNMYGCDSIITINLSINPNPSPTVNSIPNISVCAGSEVASIPLNGDIDGTEFRWVVIGHIGLNNGSSQIEISGFIANNNEASSARVIVTPTFTYDGVTCEGEWKDFHITVNPVYETPESVSICEGDTYDFFGQELSEANVYRHTLRSINDCDSIIVLNLTVNPIYETPESVSICEGDTYDFFGQELSEADVYRHTLQSINDCDSVIVLTLTVNPVYETQQTASICEGGSYNFFGRELSEADVYRHTLQSINDCDSVIVLTLTVNPVYETQQTASICEGGTYSFFDRELSEADVYRHTLRSINDCDSVIVLTLTVNPVYETPRSVTICEGDTYDFFGEELSEANVYSHTLRSINDCDSVIVLTLTVNPVYETPRSVSICEGETYDFFGEELSEANVYRHTLQSINDCDSIIVLTLTVNPLPSEIEISIVPEDGILYGDNLGEINVLGCETETTYWVECEGTPYDEITGSEDRICLGSSFAGGTYQIWGRNIHNCASKHGDVVFERKTNVNLISGNVIKLYPNPVKDIIYFENLPNNSTIKVFSQKGDLLKIENNYSKKELNISSLVPGMYNVIITTPEGNDVVYKIVKE